MSTIATRSRIIPISRRIDAAIAVLVATSAAPANAATVNWFPVGPHAVLGTIT